MPSSRTGSRCSCCGESKDGWRSSPTRSAVRSTNTQPCCASAVPRPTRPPSLDASRRNAPSSRPSWRMYAQAPVEGVFGAIAHGLGVLATALGRYDDAEHHLEAAIGLERRMRVRPWLAHAQHDLGATLLARGASGDRQRAETH